VAGRGVRTENGERKRKKKKKKKKNGAAEQRRLDAEQRKAEAIAP
jgi:hypothetical protein